VVALLDGAEGQTLIRRAARIAARCGADLLAVHITRPGGRAVALTALLVAQRQLTESLGGPRHRPPLLAVSTAAEGPDHLPSHPRFHGTDVHIITTCTPRTVRPDSTKAQPEKSTTKIPSSRRVLAGGGGMSPAEVLAASTSSSADAGNGGTLVNGWVSPRSVDTSP